MTQTVPPYLDPSLSFAARTDDLIARMTLDEKIAQMVHTAPAIDRLNVPAYDWWNEALHGVARAGVATVFPQPIGLASMWNAPLLHQVATVVSDEARAKYHEMVEKRGDRFRYRGLTFCSPNINIFRDPRWGRGHETYGECPYLTGRLGVAFIQGLQGDDDHYLKTVANAKHYAVHSGPESDRHHFDAHVSERDLRETYLPAFRNAVVEAKVFSVMGAYNRVNGEPSCASPMLLQQILREEWGFTGYVLSDCGAIEDLHAHHKLTEDITASSALGVKEGCDLNLGWMYDLGLPDAVKRGLITEEEITKALRRFTIARFMLGMFDPPQRVPFSKTTLDVVACDEHIALSRQASRESMVLLKNDGVLPLDKSMKSVLVVGPNANDRELLLGNYFGVASQPVTVHDGIRQAVSDGTRVWYSPGCRRSDPTPTKWMDSMDPWLNEAAAMADRADVVIACLGLSPGMEGEEGDAADSDGGGDRLHLDLPAPQRRLFDKLVTTGKPVIVVLLNGGGLAIPDVDAKASAVLWAGYPGEQGGAAVADVLFGDHNPAGRLTTTWVNSIDQLPPFADYAMAGRTYRFMHDAPLYPFGFGLSYTQFTYDNLTINAPAATISDDLQIVVNVDVANAGQVAGDEVAQLYLRHTDKQANADPQASESPSASAVGARHPREARHDLRGFARVSLSPGESTSVQFTLDARALSVVNDAGRHVVQPGSIEVHVGGGQPDRRTQQLGVPIPKQTTIELQGTAVVLPA